MRKNDLTNTVVVLLVVFGFGSLYATFSEAGTISDNFYSAIVNTRLWQPFHDSQNQRMFQQGGELRIQIDGASTGDEFGAGVRGKFLLKGNFEMTVDYRLITWPQANGVGLGFEGPGTSPDDPAEVMIKRSSWGVAEPQNGQEGYSASFKDGSVWYGFMNFDTAMYGSLKLTRVGSVLTGYFADQQGVWQQIGSHDYSNPGLPEWAGITLWANSKTGQEFPVGWVKVFAGLDVEIAFDNFQVIYDQIRYLSAVAAPLSLLMLD
jgi:hypothetical protein